MPSTALPRGPREGKILCTVELDLAADIDCGELPLEDVLRMSIDLCAASVREERSTLDPPPLLKPLKDFHSFVECAEYLRREREENPWYPQLEIIPPTTLFSDSGGPGVRINLSLPPDIADEVRHQFEKKWQELMRDIRGCGVSPFIELHQHPMLTGGGIFKAEYPVNRWGPLVIGSALICVKKPHRKTI
jgi:hypothetical protein